LWNLGEHLTPT